MDKELMKPLLSDTQRPNTSDAATDQKEHQQSMPRLTSQSANAINRPKDSYIVKKAFSDLGVTIGHRIFASLMFLVVAILFAKIDPAAAVLAATALTLGGAAVSATGTSCRPFVAAEYGKGNQEEERRTLTSEISVTVENQERDLTSTDLELPSQENNSLTINSHFKAVKEIWKSSMLFMVPVFSIACGLTLFLTKILGYFGQPVSVVDNAIAFLVAATPGLVFNLWGLPTHAMMMGVQRKRWPFVTNLITFFAFWGLAEYLAFGRPQLGAAGIGWAMTLRGLIGFIIIHLFLLSDRYFERFGFPGFYQSQNDPTPLLKKCIKYCSSCRFSREDFLNWCRDEWPMFKKIYHQSKYITVHALSDAFLFFAASLIIGAYLGDEGLAVHLPFTQAVEFIGGLLGLAILQATSSLVGEPFGASFVAQDHLKSEARYSTRRFANISIFLSGIFGLTVAIFVAIPSLFAKLFQAANDPNPEETARRLRISMPLAGIAVFINMIFSALAGTARGLRQQKTTLIFSAMASWLIMLPLSFFFIAALKQDVYFVHLAMTLSFLFPSIISYKHYWPWLIKTFKLHKPKTSQVQIEVIEESDFPSERLDQETKLIDASINHSDEDAKDQIIEADRSCWDRIFAKTSKTDLTEEIKIQCDSETPSPFPGSSAFDEPFKSVFSASLTCFGNSCCPTNRRFGSSTIQIEEIPSEDISLKAGAT